ncbi:iron-sulfur cluster-binding protein [Macrococcoides caseolyticum]|uniref:LutB/LldF family L-lactate oxidation iron-sulfur protein n=1 Tax=Macrococcoides caseolyticum TaxID=69966 RepID=UPI000A28E8AF|nr:LutB/LldF family L-lactate oxidation iron-sulfur protein [Macrococcus caseolyticus]ARQ03499.1 Lactate utilization protein B [Macrococcus caseolyticus]MDJ1109399.1 LutB/LldF family L-lactate oxidation iron-sulfur protein [Macrococcus caseolyticus]QYA40230.1 iron-sulfur cluster-binding protein [Macrococcus caseolyticus]
MSMRIGNETFKQAVKTELKDDFMRSAVSSAQDRLRERKLKTQEDLGNWEEWRDHSEEIRQHTLANLDYYLNMLSENVAAKGGHVFFAETAEEANQYVQKVLRDKNAKKVAKSKSMVTEEIGLNEAMEAVGCEVIETDLGEYILQVDDHNPPSHIVVPALHLNKEQIEKVFKEKLGYDKSSQPEELALFARQKLREEFLSADVGITGCNFGVAESGSFSLVTNEGNARMVTTLPKTQITVMGMERLVPTHEELEVLVSMLTRSAVGQKLTSYVTTLTGPRAEDEIDGPEEFHLIIVDNGRSKILGTQFQSILQCIRCAACVNVCPVYRQTGGHSYGSIYPGPIGAVLSPLLGGYDTYKELPYASTLCGACTEACPVKIPLHDLLLEHRRVIVEEEHMSPVAERLVMKGFAQGASHATLFKYGTKAAPTLMSPFEDKDSGMITKGPKPLQAWTNSRDFPMPDDENFRDWMQNRLKRGAK